MSKKKRKRAKKKKVTPMLARQRKNKKSALMNLFAERILKYRKARGLTQTDLAILMGIEQSGVSYLESSHREPGLTQVEAAARALNVDYRRLIT